MLRVPGRPAGAQAKARVDDADVPRGRSGLRLVAVPEAAGCLPIGSSAAGSASRSLISPSSLKTSCPSRRPPPGSAPVACSQLGRQPRARPALRRASCLRTPAPTFAQPAAPHLGADSRGQRSRASQARLGPVPRCADDRAGTSGPGPLSCCRLPQTSASRVANICVTSGLCPRGPRTALSCSRGRSVTTGRRTGLEKRRMTFRVPSTARPASRPGLPGRREHVRAKATRAHPLRAPHAAHGEAQAVSRSLRTSSGNPVSPNGVQCWNDSGGERPPRNAQDVGLPLRLLQTRTFPPPDPSAPDPAT